MQWTTLPRSRLSDQISGYQCNQHDHRKPHMVLLHGVGMQADYWSNLTTTLENTFSITAVDLPGHGQSALIKSDSPNLHDYTDVIAPCIANKPAIIVGHSMGALIALDMAVRYKRQVTGIAVLNGVYRRDEKAQRAIQTRAEELLSTPIPDPQPTLARWFGSAPQGVDAEAEAHCRQWLLNAQVKGYADAYRVFAASDAPPDNELLSIQCPAVFMTGSDEPNSTPQMSRAMSELARNSSCVIADGARHMMSMTHADLVCDTLLHFFGGTKPGKAETGEVRLQNSNESKP